jgi:GntR family transcriptional regulator/MocR family aminotransferase
LAKSLGLSRNSVLTALDRLVADGWLEARRGSGVYVSYSGHLAPGNDAPGRAAARDEAPPFQIGIPPLDMFPVRLWEQLQSRRWRKMSNSALRADETAGWPGLREAITAHVAITRGLDCSPEQVVVTTSISAGVELAVRALGLADSEAWVEDPGYYCNRRSLQFCGVRIVPVPVDACGLDVGFGARVSPGAKLAVVTPTCHFPTCSQMTRVRREEFLHWADANDAWVFEDDFDWLSVDRAQLQPPLAAVDRSRVVYFNSFNHILFPTLRIAYIIAPPQLVDRLIAVRIAIDSQSNLPNQMIMSDFVNSGHLDAHLRRLRAGYAERRAALMRSIGFVSEFLAPHDAHGGSYVVCTLHSLDEREFVELCGENGVSIVGMAQFRHHYSSSQQVLLGYPGFAPATIIDAGNRMREAMETGRGRFAVTECRG